jgi:polyisoprenoid-binding protein YceI
MRTGQKLLERRGARIAVGIGALGALAVVAVAVGLGIYIFGGKGAASTHGTITTPTLVPNTNETAFTIIPSSSQASFTIHEQHFGQPNDVVGTTNQVSGEILVNTQDPAQSRLGQIRVDLSTLVTDNDLRNQALQGRILETGDTANQYATFTATSLKGMPSTVAVGQTIHFQVIGNLTIHGVTHSATFDVTLTTQSATALKGQATTTVRYKDFNIAIPPVPSVSGVADTTTLALTFTAQAGG